VSAQNQAYECIVISDLVLKQRSFKKRSHLL